MNRGRLPAVVSLLLTLGMLTAPSASAQPPLAAPGLTADGLTRAPQQDASPDQPRTFGISASVAHTIGATAFTGSDTSFDEWAGTIVSGMRYCTVVGCFLMAPVSLPAGALVTSIEIDACDFSGAGDAQVVFRRSPAGQDAGTTLATATTSGTPGCVLVPAALAAPETIDNRKASYFLTFFTLASDVTVRLHAVRILYTLQVSPAPATATFGDVPATHPFFQFVEALVASGITAGCGGGNYCPDAPLTRGQMAVFLSKGLGLHFAP